MGNALVELLPISVRGREAELLYSWLQQKNPTTARYYARVVNAFLCSFPEISLFAVSEGHIAKFLDGRKHLSPRSINTYRNALSSLFGYLVDTGDIARNPVRTYKPKRISTSMGFRSLTEDQVVQLIGKISSRRDQVMVQMMYMCGLRVSELVDLRVRSFVAQGSDIQLVVRGKGNKMRSIWLAADFWFEICDFVLEMKDEPDTYIFRRQGGASVTSNRVYQIIREAADKCAGFPRGVSPHWLRHAHATHSLRRGASLKALQRTLGHESLSTTGRYLDVLPQESSGTVLMIPKLQSFREN